MCLVRVQRGVWIQYGLDRAVCSLGFCSLWMIAPLNAELVTAHTRVATAAAAARAFLVSLAISSPCQIHI